MRGDQPKLGNTPEGRPIYWSMERLIETRALIQANSGGGKSYAARGLLEQTHGLVQHLVLDPEGEFYTLREKYDYVLCGRGGDCPAEPRSAALLARRLLELGASAIMDIYELKKHERVLFVRRFLEAVIDAPKDLWHPTLIVLDEAHVYCPQNGNAESAGAVIDVATRGRKRGYCIVPATQRLSKLDKDLAAECNNKLIGRTGLDLDRKRAADELGLLGKDEQRKLRDLEPGEFWAFGPAISTSVIKIRTVTVQTTHPKAGQRATPRPPARDRVQKILAQLTDLPKEAEEEARTAADLRTKLRQVERELAASRRAQPAPALDENALARARQQGQRDILALVSGKAEKVYEKLVGDLVTLDRAIQAAHAHSNDLRLAFQATHAISNPATPPVSAAVARKTIGIGQFMLDGLRREKAKKPNGHSTVPPEGLDGPESRILSAIAWLETVGVPAPEEGAVAFIAGYRVGGGAFNNPKARLRGKNLIEYLSGKRMKLTEDGRAMAQAPDAPLTTEELHRMVLERLDGPEGRILRPLLSAFPEPMTLEDLARAAEYELGGGAFNNPKGRLRTLGLIDYPSKGLAVAKDFLFLEVP